MVAASPASGYQWDRNKGYMPGIVGRSELGLSPLHRASGRSPIPTLF
ncbi:hypothetical protein [Microbacterium sp.]